MGKACRLGKRTATSLLFFVARFQLMANCQYQHHVIGRHPTILSHVAELAARKEQFPASIFGLAAQQRMICKQIKSTPNTYNPLACELRVVFGEKIEEPLEVGERSSSYLDARHARARGRRTDLPATRASR